MTQSGLKVLLVGKGGREHALAWKLIQSKSVAHVYVVPGNGGTEALANVSNIGHVQMNDYPGLVALAKELGVGLVVAGPDDVIVDGIEGYFRGSKGIKSFFASRGLTHPSRNTMLRSYERGRRDRGIEDLREGLHAKVRHPYSHLPKLQ